MSQITAGYEYIEDRLEGAGGVLCGSGGSHSWRARSTFRDVLEAGQKQSRKVPLPAVLIAFAGGRDDYTYGKDRSGRGHFLHANFIVRALDEQAKPDDAEQLAYEIDRRLNPGGEASTAFLNKWHPRRADDPPGDGICILTCIRMEALRGNEGASPVAPAGAPRWMIGGRYRVIVSGDEIT